MLVAIYHQIDCVHHHPNQPPYIRLTHIRGPCGSDPAHYLPGRLVHRGECCHLIGSPHLEAFRGIPGGYTEFAGERFRHARELAEGDDCIMEIPMARHCPETGGAAGPRANLCNVYLQDNVPESHPGTKDKTVASHCTFPIKRPWPSGIPPRVPPQQHRTLDQADGSPIDRRQSPHCRRAHAGSSRLGRGTFTEREDNSPGSHQSGGPVRAL